MKKGIEKFRNEPKWADLRYISDRDFQFSLVYAFQWYNINCSSKEAKKFIIEYYKDDIDFVNGVKTVNDKNLMLSFAWLCRMLMNGLPLNEYIEKKLEEGYQNIQRYFDFETKEVKESAYERIKANLNNHINQIELMVKKYIKYGGNIPLNIEDYIKENRIKPRTKKQVGKAFISFIENIDELKNIPVKKRNHLREVLISLCS